MRVVAAGVVLHNRVFEDAQGAFNASTFENARSNNHNRR